MFFPIVGELFIEVGIFFLSNIFRLAHPKRLILIDLFKFG